MYVCVVCVLFNAVVVVGFSQSVYMVREGEMAVGIRLNSRGTTNLPITVIYSTQDDTATGKWSIAS